MKIEDYKISEFSGLNTSISDKQTLKKGVSPDALNWVTGKFQDNISLRRGTALLGQTRQTGSGKITGLGVGTRYDGVQVPFFSHDRKIKYYSSSSDDTVEIGTNILPSGADGQDVWFLPYQNLAGSFVYFGSPDSSIYKIPVANPTSYVDQSITTYRFGIAKVSQNRMFAGQRKGSTAGNYDNTGVYLSYVDKATLSSYTHVTGEAVGSSGSSSYSGTLATVSGVKTCMYVTISEAGGETLIDDRNGSLVGNSGSTGTINYATGAYSITFNHVTVGAVTADYYTEDSTSNGILDFSGSSFGQGATFRQDDGGGNLMAIWPINNVEYCIHLLKTWQLTTATSSSDTSTNLPYRNVGIPYPRAAYPTPDGIIFADLSRPTEPKFRRLQIVPNSSNLTIEPLSISDALDLTNYAFDYCVAFIWGDYEIFCVQEKVSGVARTYNSKMFIRNTYSKVWDRVDFLASCLAEYSGTLIAGDPISNNVYTLFSGFDDDGDIIANYWTDGDMNLGTDNLKSCHRMTVKGLIQRDQNIKVSLSVDGGAFVEYYTISGQGSYVDAGTNILIGSNTIGSGSIGGGDVVSANPFEVDFPIHIERFSTVRVKFEAEDIGHAQINEYIYTDIRDKGKKSLPTKTV